MRCSALFHMNVPTRSSPSTPRSRSAWANCADCSPDLARTTSGAGRPPSRSPPPGRRAGWSRTVRIWLMRSGVRCMVLSTGTSKQGARPDGKPQPVGRPDAPGHPDHRWHLHAHVHRRATGPPDRGGGGGHGRRRQPVAAIPQRHRAAPAPHHPARRHPRRHRHLAGVRPDVRHDPGRAGEDHADTGLPVVHGSLPAAAVGRGRGHGLPPLPADLRADLGAAVGAAGPRRGGRPPRRAPATTVRQEVVA